MAKTESHTTFLAESSQWNIPWPFGLDLTKAYFEYDAKKSGGVTISHLRFGPQPIYAPQRGGTG